MKRRNRSDDIRGRRGSETGKRGEDSKGVLEGETQSGVRLSRMVLSFVGLLLRYVASAIRFAFHYMFSARLNTAKELYPYYVGGEYEPKSKFGYRFFLVSNRVQNIGFGFEYRGVYYFSNSHFCANGERLEVGGRSIRLYHQGFTVLCSRRMHNMKKPKDDEDLYLLNPYMPTIKGKCIYKNPFYYSFFPMSQACMEFTGLPIVNSRGELVSTYDNFRQVDETVYNIIGDVNLWEGGGSDASAEYGVECVPVSHRGLRVFKVTSGFSGEHDAWSEDAVGYFFSYNSVTYISGAFIDDKDSGSPALSLSPERHEGIKETDRYSNLYRDLWISAPDCKHNLSLPEQDEEAVVLDVAEEEGGGGVRGVVKLDERKQFWAEFEGIPDRRRLGLPILDRAGQLIGVYSDFNVKNRFNRLKYSVYLGGSSTFKSHFLRMSLRNDSIQVLKADCDLEILEQVVLLCSPVGNSCDNQRPGGVVDRVIFGVGSEDISQKILDGINTALDKHLPSSSRSDCLVSVANHASTKYTNVQDKKFIIASTDWIGYSHLNSDNSFPFNSPKNLLILLPHRSCLLTEQLLDRYYKNTHKATRGLYIKLIPA